MQRYALMTEAEIRKAMERRAVPGNAFSRYLQSEELIQKLAAKKFKSEAAFMKFLFN